MTEYVGLFKSNNFMQGDVLLIPTASNWHVWYITET